MTNAPIFDQWVFGRTTGSKQHAVMRTRTEGFRNPITGEQHDLVYTMRALCGARDAQGMVRAGNEAFDPSGRANVCTACSRRWTAQHGPQVPGWTKECAACHLDRPVNQFHVDRRTKDGMSTTCYDCTQGAKVAIKTAEAITAHEAERHRVLAETERHHARRMEVLTRFQESALLPTFRCTQRHALIPVRVTTEDGSTRFPGTAFPHEAWSCACGTRRIVHGGARPSDGEVDLDWRSVFDAVRAVETILDLPTPGSLDMSQVPA